MSARKRGAPAVPRAVCGHCGKKGLGNRYPHPSGGTYRQCTYCSEIDHSASGL